MLKFAALSEKGGREINEDAIGWSEKNGRYCFVLCDGLGGQGMGDRASSLVRDSVLRMFDEGYVFEKFIADAFENAERRLVDEQDAISTKNKMKTTCVLTVVDQGNAYVGHIGDSRLYIFYNNKVVKRTIDHSVPQMLALAGRIKEGMIRNHPDRNKVLRALGSRWEKPEYELMEKYPLAECQAMLLCSDGFWENIEEKDMCHYLKKSDSVEDWLQGMTKKVLKGNKRKLERMDNYSAIGIWNVE